MRIHGTFRILVDRFKIIEVLKPKNLFLLRILLGKELFLFTAFDV